MPIGLAINSTLSKRQFGPYRVWSIACNYLKAVSNFFSNMESTNFYLWVFLRESKATTYFFGFLCKNEKHQLIFGGFFAVKKSNKLLKKWTFLRQSPEIYMHMFGAMEHVEMYRAEKLFEGA